MRTIAAALACLAAASLAACVTGAPAQTQWGRQARQQCDRQPDPRSRGECHRRVEEAERSGQIPAELQR